jgi:hypothetical protein
MQTNSYSAEKKAVALATIVMSIPLLLTFNIKYQWFPEGLLYEILFFWLILLSIWVVPVLLLILIVLGLLMVRSKASDRSALRWVLWGIAIGLIAEVIFLAAVNSPPVL